MPLHGIHPDIWGQSCWLTLNCIARNYPLEPTPREKEKFIQLIECLEVVLPCSCKDNFPKSLKKLQWTKKKTSYLKNRESFSRFIHALHNCINKDLGKPLVPYEEFLKVDQFRVECDSDGCKSQSRYVTTTTITKVKPSSVKKGSIHFPKA